LQPLPHKLETDVLVDQPQQMVLGNLILQAEVEQRFRTSVASHHYQQASENQSPAQHATNF
jgi:hypothetical protein